LLPAPVFRATADLQARRRLGLTATLVREDGREGDVFALVGPKRFDVPGRISSNRRGSQPPPAWRSGSAWHTLLDQYADGRVLVIGEYLDQVGTIAKEIAAPLVTGKTPQPEPEHIYDRFRRGDLHCIVLSKVGNFAIDLPDADVLIQVSGTFGSRQEEAQRLGRILRPKRDGRTAHFFTLVSRDSREEEFAHHRKLFLTEQGYSYHVVLVDGR